MVEVSVANSNFIFEISNLNYPGIYSLLAEHGNADGHSLQTVSEVTNGLIIEVSDLNNLCKHASLISKCL